MGSVFDKIITFITSIIAFLFNIISGFFQLFFNIPKALNFLTLALSVIPNVIATIVTAMVAVSVVYLVIDR